MRRERLINESYKQSCVCTLTVGLKHQLEAAAFIGGIGHKGNEEVIVSSLEGTWWHSTAEAFSQQWSGTIRAVSDLHKAVEKHSWLKIRYPKNNDLTTYVF